MSDLTVTSPVNIPAAAYTPAKASSQGAAKPAPKYDVIDLSKPPTAEQAERMRSAGILGYGTASFKKVTVTDSTGATAVVGSYQNTFFDAVNEATWQTSATGAGVFASGGSAYTGTASLTVQSWNDGSWTQATYHESAFHLELHGGPSWVIPPHVDEEGTLHLAQFGSSAKATISGYRSSLTVAQSSGGTTQVSHLETSAIKAEVTIPKRPAGAISYNDWFLRSLPKGTLDLLNRQAALLSRCLDPKL